MREVTFSTLRSQARRFVAPGLAIVLGTLFMAIALIFGATLNHSITKAMVGDIGTYSAVVSPAGDQNTARLSAAQAEQTRTHPDVAEVHVQRTEIGYLSRGNTPGGNDFAMVTTPPGERSDVTVTEGRMARTPQEIAISAALASSTKLKVGEQATFSVVPASEASGVPDKSFSLTVVGLVDASDDARYGGFTPIGFATDAALTAWTGEAAYSQFDVMARNGVTPEALTTALQNSLGTGTSVMTGPAKAEEMAADLTGETMAITGFLVIMAVVSLLVSMMVIANTFAVLLARRTRETALLRCVGATRRQIVAATSAEALVLGLVGSLVGVTAAVGLAYALGSAMGGLDLVPIEVAIPLYALIAPMVMGVLVTVLAALLPVLRASRVSPLAALQPDLGADASSRVGRVRATLGVVMLALGMAPLGAAALGYDGWLGNPAGFVGGVAAGAVSFVGVALLGTVLFPRLASAVGRILVIATRSRAGGVPVELAVENTARNPRRTAATASALLVGVTLIVTTMVGAATAKSSVTSELDRQFPVDVVVADGGSPLDPAAVSRLAGVEGVASTSSVSAATVNVAGTSRRVGVADEHLADVVRDPARAAPLRTGVMLVAEGKAPSLGLRDGDLVTVSGTAGSKALTVATSKELSEAYTLIVTETDAKAVNGSVAPASSLWMRLDDSSRPEQVLNNLREVLPDTAELGGGAPQREQIGKAIDVMLAISGGLLAVSILIALVGVANTLSLSAIERTRESALLRALGLTRGQLRASLAVEGGLLSLVGAVVGAALGVVYGWAGVRALIGGADIPVVADVPWVQVAGVLAVALLAGLAASALPARHAVKVKPAVALAAD